MTTDRRPALPAELQGLCDHLTILRLNDQGRMEWPRHSVSMRAQFDRLHAAGMVEVERTPKGRKVWGRLTDKGRALVPIAQAHRDAVSAWIKRRVAAEDALAKLQAAGPSLAEALKPFATVGRHMTPNDAAALDKVVAVYMGIPLTVRAFTDAAQALKDAGVEL